MAIQCLETAFGVSLEDQGLAVSRTLPEIFEAAAGKVSQFPKYVLTFNVSSQSDELCLVSATVLPPREACGSEMFWARCASAWEGGGVELLCGSPYLSTAFSLSL